MLQADATPLFFIFASLGSRGQLLNGKNLLLEEQILSFKSRPHFEGASSSGEANRKSKLFPFVEMAGVYPCMVNWQK